MATTVSKFVLRALVVALALPVVASQAGPLLVRTATGPAQETQQATRSQVEQAVFNALDTNHDGYISATEATALPELAQSFALLDTNHDGRIDRTQFHVAMAAAFWAIANIQDTPVKVALNATTLRAHQPRAGS